VANGLGNQFKDLRTEQYRAIYDKPIYPKNQYLETPPEEGWLAREDRTRAKNIETLIERGVIVPPTGYGQNGKNGGNGQVTDDTVISDTAQKTGAAPDA
jgi:hypothetical protein